MKIPVSIWALIVTCSSASTFTVLWDPNPQSEYVTNYNVMWGHEPGYYLGHYKAGTNNGIIISTWPHRVLNDTNIVNPEHSHLPLFIIGTTSAVYYIAATAENQFGESDLSEELVVTNRLQAPGIYLSAQNRELGLTNLPAFGVLETSTNAQGPWIPWITFHDIGRTNVFPVWIFWEIINSEGSGFFRITNHVSSP